MNGCILALLALSSLLHACVSASGGLSAAGPGQAALPSDDAAEEDAPSYISPSENALPDGDRAPPSDGFIRALYGWPAASPQLVDGLRAALEASSAMAELHPGQDGERDARFDAAGDWLPTLRAPNEGGPLGFESARPLPKRAPTGFTGMRGRRIPSGFNGMRGKKSYSLFGSWNNQALQDNPKTFRDGKRAPSGFLGMRGKKSIDTSLDEQWSMDDLSTLRQAQAKEYPSFLVLDPTFGPALHLNPVPLKRVPNGFMGLRGKKDCC